jgi:signal transduction histidine kinase
MRIAATDAAFALGLTLAGQVEIWAPDLMVGTGSVDGARPVLSATNLVLTGSVALRRPAPLAFVATAAGATALQGALTSPTEGLTGLIVLALAAFTAGLAIPLPWAAASLVALLAAVVPVSADLADWSFAALLLGAAAAAGSVLRRRAEAVRVAEIERDAAAASERARIARELHDIVAHRVTTTVVQAQAAKATLATDPESTLRSLEAIDRVGRQALSELRDLLGVLRGDDEPEERRPQPGLVELRRLVDDARAAGLPVTLAIEGEVEVESGPALAVFRIVQEALTNVVKHAHAATTEVVVRQTGNALEVCVADAGPGGPVRAGGHGLVGMRERAAVYGGSVEAGEREDGGFVVRATVPVRS